MQQFRPFASIEETNGVGLIEKGEELKWAPQASLNWTPTEDISSFPPYTTSPLNLFPGQFAGTGTRITEQLEPMAKASQVSTGPLSLASALKATMSINTAGKRIVIIP